VATDIRGCSEARVKGTGFVGGMGLSGVGRDGVGLGVGTVAPMQRYVVSKEQWLRCQGGEGHSDIEGVEDVNDTERRGVEGRWCRGCRQCRWCRGCQ